LLRRAGAGRGELAANPAAVPAVVTEIILPVTVSRVPAKVMLFEMSKALI
jgi:hypothetical protein